MSKKAKDVWDGDNTTTGSYLDGRTVTVTEAEFVRHNCRGHCEEQTALRVRFHIDDVPDEKQPFPKDYKVGTSAWPSTDGEDKAPSGPRVISGVKVNKNSRFYGFRTALIDSGFPMDKFAEKGTEALVGARFILQGVSKTFKIKGDTVVSEYDVPVEFLGYGEEAEEAEPVDMTAATDLLGVALKEALEKNDGKIPRAQISIRLSQVLGDHELRPQVLELATDDEVLGSLDGITFTKNGLALS